MAVTADRETVGSVSTIERWVFDTSPLWLLALCVLVAATVVHGFEHSTAMWALVEMSADPFTEASDVGAWGYSSPVAPLLYWATGATTANGIALVHYFTTIIVIIGCASAIAKWETDYAARLFVLAYWCSPHAWANTAYLGPLDIVTIGCITLTAVAPAGVSFAAGIALGFNHFEQGVFALVAVAVIRVVFRRQSWQPIGAAFAGLAIGKVFVVVYLVGSDISPNGRLDFIRDQGFRALVEGWNGHLPVMVWAVFNVLWVGMIWMARELEPRRRNIIAGLFVFLTLPVLITFDLSRVYRTLTWPLVILLVVYASEHHDRALVRRWSLMLAAAAVFVPRTEIWYGGLVLN